MNFKNFVVNEVIDELHQKNLDFHNLIDKLEDKMGLNVYHCQLCNDWIFFKPGLERSPKCFECKKIICSKCSHNCYCGNLSGCRYVCPDHRAKCNENMCKASNYSIILDADHTFLPFLFGEGVYYLDIKSGFYGELSFDDEKSRYFMRLLGIVETYNHFNGHAIVDQVNVKKLDDIALRHTENGGIIYVDYHPKV